MQDKKRYIKAVGVFLIVSLFLLGIWSLFELGDREQYGSDRMNSATENNNLEDDQSENINEETIADPETTPEDDTLGSFETEEDPIDFTEDTTTAEQPVPVFTTLPESCDQSQQSTFDDFEKQQLSYAQLVQSFTGEWTGCVYTPWDRGDGTLMTINLYQDGSYSIENISSAAEPALYYGVNDNSEHKKISISDVQDNGLGSGEIQLTFLSDNFTNSSFYDLEVDGNRARFSFLHRNDYGPIELLLVRKNQ